MASRNDDPSLPEDVVRSILEIATEADHATGWKCTTVSKSVQACLRMPSTYPAGSSQSYTGASRCTATRTFQALPHHPSHPSKQPDFFAIHVKTVYLHLRTTWGLPIAILDACHNVRRIQLHFWKGCRKAEFMVGRHAVWQRLKPWMLKIPMSLFIPSHRSFGLSSPAGSNVFANVTHLELDCLGVGSEEWSWASLSSLGTLTHLCLSTYSNVPYDILALWAHLVAATPFFPPSLTVCVLSLGSLMWLGDAREIIEENAQVLDDRVVVAVDRTYYDAKLSNAASDSCPQPACIWRWSLEDEQDMMTGDDFGGEPKRWLQAGALSFTRSNATSANHQAGWRNFLDLSACAIPSTPPLASYTLSPVPILSL
ncbi:hypothetical protein D9611_015103 [Ephemerocybe angulata]|uniref:Uncharacterized protein n=1 Tax=Ephemerocybe angulata TaxID=980116 RepID=A0A8H5C2H0_9AGAR|nr:hypothetical protein D9611_015103 [Tulosesus angulatus]